MYKSKRSLRLAVQNMLVVPKSNSKIYGDRHLQLLWQNCRTRSHYNLYILNLRLLKPVISDKTTMKLAVKQNVLQHERLSHV